MSDTSNLIAAIDIGTTKIVAVVGRKTEDGRMHIVGIEKVPSTGVKRGVVLNIEETVNAIKDLVFNVEAKYDVKLYEVYVGIAGQHIKSLQNRGYRYIETSHEITQYDVDQLYKDNFKIPLEAGENILHVFAQDYVVDNESGVKNPIGMSGRRLEGNYHIVLGRVASVNNIEKCINRVGLKLNDLILEPMASARSVLTAEEKEAGVVLVDIGGGTTDVAVFYDGVIQHTAVIPFGGNVVTSDVKEGCAVLQKQAESLKTQFGSALGDLEREDMVVTIPGIEGWEPKEISFKSLAYIIQARMEEIVDYVMYQIECSKLYDKLGAGIVITGGGALLKNLPQLVKFRTGLEVRIGIPNKYLVDSQIDEVSKPIYSTSIGLLLSAMDNPIKKVVEQKLFDDDLQEDEAMTKKAASQPRKEKKRREKPEYTTGDLFGSFKKTIAGIFDEKDVEM
ncbi:cell division protein FtsA [Saccharicrinis fermentans]|uniref:Cell division protein FtsA n=1 Tax=Saccharicrinis fermentans DSM 9555 = JCM 21142 TaxID=869213 RepID=W7XWH2_9BACT|nr:cell division protein FtsA [Saccharicrinis fermentans]GAF02660.1 cell division protein FtsA [Saccharicrinis fermentans DSM 9555 = JCM 21142]